jgi:hypothetical protein
MKCPKCGFEVKPNYRFCTKCGQPMPAGETVSEKKLKDEQPAQTVQSQPAQTAKAAQAQPSQPNINNIEVIRGKAVWNIAPGQLARRVTESEFAQLDHMKGVVIDLGTTAVVTVDGLFMGMLSEGYYEFANETIRQQAQASSDREEREERADQGVFERAGQVARRVWRFLTGKKDKEQIEVQRKREERVNRNIERITSNSVINVTLVSTRVFDLLFGSSTDTQGKTVFAPLNIKTKVVDLEMGVSLQMQITNVNDFLKNYLADRKSFSIADAQHLAQPAIENLLGRVLRNLDYQAEGLPEELVGMIKGQIQKTVNERLFGLEVVQVLDITDQSADFGRFRAVEHELFASEQELGFLQRTNEFRNRLAEETNNQTVQEAKTEEELRYTLSKINRDGLLHEDEMEAFVQLLESQKRLREAKTEEQEYEALQDLRKNRLVKDEDVAVLEDLIARKELERTEVTELLRLRVIQNTEEARIKAETSLTALAQQGQFGLETNAARHEVEMTELELEAQRKRDEYGREQETRDYELERQRRMDEMSLEQQQAEFEHQQRRAEKFDDLDVLERKAAIARANMEKMQEHERQLEEMKRKNEALRIQTEAGMTQEQIAAAHMADMAGLDAAAQAEMAKMMGSGKEKEAEMLRQQQERESQLYQQMIQMMQQNQQGQQQSAQMSQEQMLEMMRTMMSGMSQMGQSMAASQQAQNAQQQAMQQQRVEDAEKMKEEYRDQAIRQQQRTDQTQDSALEYTTRVTESSQENNPSITVTTVHAIFCPNCGGKATTADKTCPHCGEPLEE